MFNSNGLITNSRNIRHLSAIILLASSIWGTASAEVIDRKMPNGLTATADYYQGQADKPVVLILHGFMQTREFPTVARLANSLKDEGYTVLVPTLTLNIDKRNKSLACEAVHTHTMEEDVSEIAEWVDWLYARQKKQITLIAHSAGSLTLLALMESRPDPRIEKLILVSLLPFNDDPLSENTVRAFEQAQEDVKQGRQGLGDYSLAFCDKYPSEPEAYLSYRRWGHEPTIQALNELTVPAYVIIGGSDKRMQPGWRELLKETSAQVIKVEDAGHFFDTQYEFDLLDRIIEITGQ
jgi:pimeloyl-ACP methyl ester carboxylesterase